MWDTSRTRTALVGFAMVLAVFAANGFIEFHNLRRIRLNMEITEHSHALLAELRTLRVRLADAESGMRGYVIAGDPKFLATHNQALAAVDTSLDRIAALSEELPTQQGSVEVLRLQVAASVGHLRRMTTLAREGRADEASQLIGAGGGLALTNSIRLTLREMESEAHDMLAERQQESNTSYATALATGLISTLFGMGLTIVAYLLVRHEMRRRDDVAQQLQQANDFLEQRVASRTAELSQANSLMRAEVDERRRAEETVRLFADELQRSNRELEQFASVASHDLQEPLRKIQAFGDRLGNRFRDELGDQGREWIDRMLSSATRMRKLIDDLLEYSRVSTRAHPFAPVDLNEVVQEVAADLEFRLHQSGGRIEVGELPKLRASPLQMRQLFQNLIGNGLKFQRPTEPPVVRISATTLPLPSPDNGDSSAGLQCAIVVEDNGIGFEPEYGERIFELFQRLHGRHEYEGTGIGLAICRKIVERHNGHIVAHGAPNQGARFVVTLPLAASPQPPPREMQPPQAPPAASQN